MQKTKLILVGGFLGAGKTTLLGATARRLQRQGVKVGLITNDQAKGLVDTHILSASGTEVEEIAGSCFCCNFDGLMQAALYLRDTAGCETIVAEPVGSCTDLSATLMQPIKSYYKSYFRLAPLTVLIDPFRLKETFEDIKNVQQGSGYIYLKQLEEADHLAINKTDLLDNDHQQFLKTLLQDKFRDYPVHYISALNEKGIQNWLEALDHDQHAGTRIAEVDYDLYAKGEALMGWYNATFIVSHDERLLVPWAEFNYKFLQLLQQVFQREAIAIGHLKTFIKSGPSHLNANLTGKDREISIQGTPFSSSSARLVVNIRAEVTPDLLREIVEDIIDAYTHHHIEFQTIELKHLSPGRPVPTHRYSKVAGN
ncbi:GTP-binding protein [Fulvivirgaceae bacterium BMA10]|uniref:GTP-binding protein n=1 Tax=Splendidivirga corallicola TaxID=3051826 RepID=A0ABT8KVT2_9BACT|nr:GTP-binding protein [Fulvivirgaceae bacterium BMA10]